jgi:hypothetical protein
MPTINDLSFHPLSFHLYNKEAIERVAKPRKEIVVIRYPIVRCRPSEMVQHASGYSRLRLVERRSSYLAFRGWCIQISRSVVGATFEATIQGLDFVITHLMKVRFESIILDTFFPLNQ